VASGAYSMRLGKAFSYPSRAAWAAIALTAISAAVILTLNVNRSLPLVSITGSPTPEGYDAYSAENILGGTDFVRRPVEWYRVFVTSAEDGHAFAAIEFANQQSFKRIEHYYAWNVLPKYRVQAAAILWSDDGRTWTDAASARSESGQLFFDVRNAGAHKHWRFLVLESGESPGVRIGSIHFHRSFWDQVPIDLLWLAWCFALLSLAATSLSQIKGWQVYAIIATSAALFVFTYAFCFSPYWITTTPDSPAYASPLINGTYSAWRSSGYPSFLRLVHGTVGLANLAAVQLILELSCMIIAVGLLSHTYGYWIAGSLLIILLSFFGAPVVFATRLLTEALFFSGFVLFAAALAAAARRPGIVLFTIAGVGLAIAITAKAVSIVLIVPAILLARFIPRRSWGRAFTGIIILPVATYLALSFHAYWRTDILKPEATGGFALIGHVGGFLGGEMPEMPGLIGALREAASPVLARRPPDLTNIRSKQELDAYVDYTAQEHDTLLASIISAATPLAGSNIVQQDPVLMQVAVKSIGAHPLDYARHVAAHYYGLWRDLALYWPNDLVWATGYIRAGLAINDPIMNWPSETANKFFAPLLPPMPVSAEAQAASAQQRAVPLAFRELLRLPFSNYQQVSIGIGVLCTLLPFLLFFPGRLARCFSSEIMLALVLDAYALGHALFQVSMKHYAAVMMPIAVLFVVCLAATTLKPAWRWSNYKSRGTSAQPAPA
jgi:hypothetical protein